MDLFHNAKVIRLRSHDDKYLTAPKEEEEESVVTQDLNGFSKGARWTVEYLDNDNSVNIRLKSCNGKYLTASDQPFLLGMTGRKVLQTLPPRLDSSVEWEPIREGNRVKLKTSYGGGTFLQGNRSVPPWRNSVISDIANCTASQDWILWEVDVVEIVIHSATCEKDKRNIVHNPEHLTMLLLALPEQSCRPFSLTEILSATNNFDESLVIGQGGFGKVYKGVIENGASVVAIKKLNSTSKQGDTEFRTEIEMLSKFRHSHILSLIGYCYSSIEMILVYKYMVNGSLADHLYKIGKCGSCSTLSWVQRLKICLGAARGLDYLHTGTGVQGSVIHRDVKSSNILLDKNYAAKVSDFGLSRMSPIDQSCTYISTNVKGTMGYMDPEYFLTLRLTMKSDVYSFGVVMFEVLCGRRALDLTLDEEQWSLARWAQHCIDKGTLHQIIDPNLRWEILPESLTEFARIANQCLCYWSKKRPTMTQVVGSLELALALQLGHKDSSTFEMEIFCTSEAGENLEKVDSTMVQDEAIKFGSCNEDSKDIMQSRINRTKRKALTDILRPFMFCTVQEASEKDIPPRFLDEEMFLKEARTSGSGLQSSGAGTAGSDLTQGSDFEEKVANLVGLGFRRVAVILALKIFHGNEQQAAGYLFGRSI